jgi:hypothetical protein
VSGRDQIRDVSGIADIAAHRQCGSTLSLNLGDSVVDRSRQLVF